MVTNCLRKVILSLLFVLMLGFPFTLVAQEIQEPKTKSAFWQKVQIGGGLGLGFGSGFTNIAVAPSAIYNVNQYVAVGAGLQYSYLKQRDYYNSHLYGASVIGLFNPIEQVQLSVEVEQLRANVKTDGTFYNGISDNFWNTGLFFGAGYRMENVRLAHVTTSCFKKTKAYMAMR